MSDLNPHNSDAILGGNTPFPLANAVLGGLVGVQKRLESETLEARLSALTDAFQYGEMGINLIVQALTDPAEAVQRLACKLLRDCGDDLSKQLILTHHPFNYFTTLADWQVATYNPQIGIVDPENNAYAIPIDYLSPEDIDGLDQIRSLFQDPKISELQALVVEIGFFRGRGYHGFGAAIRASAPELEREKRQF